MSHLKVIGTSQGPIHRFTSLKRKLYKCSANIYFNQKCLKNKLTPTYARVKFPKTSPAGKYTQQKAQNMRIRDEIKFLHAKKQQLNYQIYRLHLTLANTWNNTWHYIQHTIENKIQKEAQKKYHKLDKKIEKLIQSQTTKPLDKQDFYPRVVNNTDIHFSNNEMTLLQKGLKYNLHTKQKNWIQDLALEAETAIQKLPISDRDTYRHLVATRINTLKKNNNSQHTHGTPLQEAKTIKNIRSKLQHNDAIITRADKGNSIVILPAPQYSQKLQKFIQNNNLKTSHKDPTRNFQAQIRETIANSKTLIPRDSRWKYTNMNPSAPTIKGLIKLHKPDQPIRPVVNWKNAPAYKLAQSFTLKIKQLAPPPNTYNIENTRDLIDKLKHTPITPNLRLASLDITNLYTNVPVKETKEILSNKLEQNNVDPKAKHELINWYNTITAQNYFTHEGNTLIQNDGLAMGAPSSGIISELFLQHIEHTHLDHLTMKHKITNYYRYVDDILVIYDSDHTDIQAILKDFNTIHPKLAFTAEGETNSKLNYLDITIQRTNTDWRTSIYRKPTFTDTIIPYTSNHPTQHKYAAIRFLYNRLNTYDLHTEEYKQEEQAIQNILVNNSFPIQPQKPTKQKPRHTDKTTQPEKQKWTTFTYTGRETTYITNIFKKTNLKIAYKTNNTIDKRLTHKTHKTDKYTQSGIYKLTCPVCNKAYVGQTGRNFTIRFNEHKQAFRTNSHTSSFAQHLIEHNHPFGTIQNTMQVLRHHHKGTHLNTLEKFHIYTEYISDNHINDNQTIFPNKIFDAILKDHSQDD